LVVFSVPLRGLNCVQPAITIWIRTATETNEQSTERKLRLTRFDGHLNSPRIRAGGAHDKRKAGGKTAAEEAAVQRGI
jgi:hypothetical protein